MSRTERIRQSADGALDRWQVRAEAIESQFDASKDQAMEKVEASKQAYLNTIDKAKAGIAQSKTLADAEKQRLQAKLDGARVQVALGKAETAEELNKQREVLKTELSNVEKEVDAELAAFDNEVDETLDQMARDLVEAADALDAEMDAAAARLVALKAKASADVNVSVAEVKLNVDGFKAKIDAKRNDASASVREFDSEFNQGWNQIISAFKNLK